MQRKYYFDGNSTELLRAYQLPHACNCFEFHPENLNKNIIHVQFRPGDLCETSSVIRFSAISSNDNISGSDTEFNLAELCKKSTGKSSEGFSSITPSESTLAYNFLLGVIGVSSFLFVLVIFYATYRCIMLFTPRRRKFRPHHRNGYRDSMESILTENSCNTNTYRNNLARPVSQETILTR